jgi:hypothetical protein
MLIISADAAISSLLNLVKIGHMVQKLLVFHFPIEMHGKCGLTILG